MKTCLVPCTSLLSDQTDVLATMLAGLRLDDGLLQLSA